MYRIIKQQGTLGIADIGNDEHLAFILGYPFRSNQLVPILQLNAPYAGSDPAHCIHLGFRKPYAHPMLGYEQNLLRAVTFHNANDFVSIGELAGCNCG
ncbi:hypothetical protein D3C78_1582350 [compost metagenome]